MPLLALTQGNHLNVAAGKGPAAGFSLSSILELGNIKGKDRQTSVLRFAVLQMDKAHPGELTTVLAMGPLLLRAGAIQMHAVRSWLDELAQGVAGLCSEMQHASTEQEGEFLAAAAALAERGQPEVAALRELEQEASESLEMLARYFHQPLCPTHPSQHIDTLSAFVNGCLRRAVDSP